MTGPETLSDRLQRYSAAVMDELRAAIATRHGLPTFYGMLHYHLGWVDQDMAPTQASAGKGLRAAFCLLCCEVFGGDWRDVVAIAGAIELLHNFSLIHDDIEDGSHTRRHRRTVWSLWGAPQAINLGDALFALAGLTFFRSPLARRDPVHFLEIVRAANETIVDLAEGQYLDIDFETRQSVSTQEYLTMIERKSAVLIAMSAWAGAVAAGADERSCRAIRAFGRELGLAFQVRDDVLGIWGDEAVTGKSHASDILSRKKTLPVLQAFEQARPDDLARLREIYAADEEMDDDTMSAVLAILDATGARARAEEELSIHRRAADEALSATGLTSQGAALLREFSHLLVDRSA